MAQAPRFADQFHEPGQRHIDLPLVGGAVLFGAGWGLVGYCPGPALASALLSTDALIFTAGIGENSPSLRAAVCANLEFCGLELDPELNTATRATETIISKPSSKIEVRVIPTNEEIVIARNAWAKLQESH